MTRPSGVVWRYLKTRTVVQHKASQGSKSSSSHTSTRSRPSVNTAVGGCPAYRRSAASRRLGTLSFSRTTAWSPSAPTACRNGAVAYAPSATTSSAQRRPLSPTTRARHRWPAACSLSPGPYSSASHGTVTPTPTPRTITPGCRNPSTSPSAVRTGWQDGQSTPGVFTHACRPPLPGILGSPATPCGGGEGATGRRGNSPSRYVPEAGARGTENAGKQPVTEGPKSREMGASPVMPGVPGWPDGDGGSRRRHQHIPCWCLHSEYLTKL